MLVVQIQVNFVGEDSLLLYRKAIIVAKKRSQSVSSYFLYLIRQSEPFIDEDLSLLLDKSDKAIRDEIRSDLARGGISHNRS